MKVLLIIYLITIGYYFLGLVLAIASILGAIKREGCKFQKYSTAELVVAWIRIIILGLIPIINIIFGSVYLFSNELKDAVLEQRID